MPRTIRPLAIAAIVIFAVQLLANNEADVDLWGNVGFVTDWPGTEQFLRTNTFSFTEPAHTWVNHEWLAQYVFHKVYASAGTSGLLALKVLIGLLLLAAIHLSVRARTARDGPAYFFFMLLVISTMGYGFSTRPHLFTYLFTVLSLHWLLRAEDGKRYPLVVLPLLAVPWANLHGAFFIGLILMLLFGIVNVLRAIKGPRTALTRGGLMLLSAAGFWIGSLLTPFGFDTWSFIGQSAVIVRPYLSEWAPLNPIRHFADHVDFLALLVACAVALLFTRRRRNPSHWVALLVSIAAAFALRRNIPLCAIAAAMLVTPHFVSASDAALRGILSKWPRLPVPLALAAFICISGAYTTVLNTPHPTKLVVPARRYPRETVAFMRANGIAGNALIFFDWGEYCIWHLYPQCRVFMDGRFRSAYSETVIADYFSFLYAGDTWRNALDNYPTDIVLVHTGNPVTDLMRAHPDWVHVYHTDTADLFLKRAAHAALLQRLVAEGPRLPSLPPIGLFP